jgi:acyl-CoA synthetase (AMP-forming)/AMP-acid ligase II
MLSFCLLSSPVINVRKQDILKVSGVQVSPVEIENVLLAHPQKLIQDVTVAGVSGGRTSDEKVPRAWVVLSPEGQKLGVSRVMRVLDEWHRENLSKYKWLRGGIEVVKEVCALGRFRSASLVE